MPRRYTCPYCDGVVYSDEQRCRACGAKNPYYTTATSNRNASDGGRNSIVPKQYNNTSNNNTNHNSANNSSSSSSSNGCADFKLSEQNGCVAILIIILAIWFWPITLIYLIYRVIAHSGK